MLLATFCGGAELSRLRGLSIPLLLPDGTLSGRYLLVFLATGVISFRWFAALLFCRYYWGKSGIFSDNRQKEEEAADLFMAKMAILSVQKTEQRLLRAEQKTSITS